MSETSAKASIRELSTKAQAIVEDITLGWDAKSEQLDKLGVDLKKAQDEYAVHQKAREFAGAGDAAPEEKSTRSARVLSLGEQVTASDAYKALQASRKSGGRFTHSVELKTTPAPGDGDSAGGTPDGLMSAGSTPTADGMSGGGNIGPLLAPTYVPGMVQQFFAPLAIVQLFPQGTIDGPMLSYVKETGWTNNAAPVAEGGLKPTSTAELERAVEQVGKIANVMRVTDELVADASAFMSFLNQRLTLGLDHIDEREILLGDGYPSVHGLLKRTGLQTPIAETGVAAGGETAVIEAVYRMVTQIRITAFVEPECVVTNPLDWQHIRLAKDANGQYYGGGPFTGAYGNGGFSNVDSLFGLRAVSTPRMPSAHDDSAHGGMLVGSFSAGAQVFTRQGITVEMTNSHEDDFSHDRIAIRAERRRALAVWRPGAFGLVQPTWA